jgi:hypothetical protein
VRLRTAFQAVIDRFDENRAILADDESYAGLIMQIDARIVGAMIVNRLRDREAAREALAPIGDTLADLSTRFAAAQ